MKRMKVPDYKDKNVFGVPLIVHVQRFGQPLPLGVQQALRYLRSQCLDQVSQAHQINNITVPKSNGNLKTVIILLNANVHYDVCAHSISTFL